MFRIAYAAVIILVMIATVNASFAGSEHSCGSSHNPNYKNFGLIQTLQRLLSALVTRPEVISDSDQRALRPAFHAGAEAFVDAFHRGNRINGFSRDLRHLLDTYQTALTGAAAGIEGAGVRGAAMDRLLAGLLDAAKQSNIDLEDVDMALLRAAAEIEKEIQRPPAAKVLSLEDRELISSLLLCSVNQIHRRVVSLTEPPAAMATLGIDPELILAYTQRLIFSRPALVSELAALEKSLSDPSLIGNVGKLITMQLNIEAINDLFFFKLSMEAYLLANNLELTSLATKMASMGGIMSDMTVTRLQESGAIPRNFLIITAYNWVTPSTPLTYTPDPTLTNKLGLLGVILPSPPDFLMFSSPFRDIFQLRYDLSLCDQITSKEWSDAEKQSSLVNTGLLSMSERLALRKADVARRHEVMSRIKGINTRDMYALRILLTGFYGK